MRQRVSRKRYFWPLASASVLFLMMGAMLSFKKSTTLPAHDSSPVTAHASNELNVNEVREMLSIPDDSPAVVEAHPTLMSDTVWPEAEVIAMDEEYPAEGAIWKRLKLLAPSTLDYPVRVEEKIRIHPETGEEEVLSRIEMVANRVLVQLDAGQSIDDFMDSMGDSRITGYKQVSETGLYLLNMKEVELEGVPELVGDLHEFFDFVEFAEPDFLVHPTRVPNDSGFNVQWALQNIGQSGGVQGADIDAAVAWDIRTDASDIVVAITDTGIRYTHQDLQANMWVNAGEIAGDGLDNDGNGVIDDVYGFNGYADNGDPMDVDGHGTHVAGIVGARANNGTGVSGVAWNVQLMAVKFLHGGTGSTSDGIEVIDYAVENGADVINASWGGGGFSTSLYNAIARARNAGIIFVAAAGNSSRNADASPHYPSSYDLTNIVSVASSTRTDDMSGFSNYGAVSVDIAAPGSSIYATYHTSDSAYATLSGTSMAAPCVAGMLAILAAEFSDENYLDLIERLYSGVESLSAFQGKVKTGGRANLLRSLEIPAGQSAPSVLNSLSDSVVPMGSAFTFSVEAHGSDPLTYVWEHNGVVIPGENSAELTIASVGPADGGVYRLIVSNPYGNATTEATIQALSGFDKIGEALEIPALDWSMAGDEIWRIQNSTTVVGDTALKSGVVTHNQQSELKTTVDGPGMVSFRWKVSSETFYDFLQFYSGSTMIYAISGDVDWNYVQYNVPAGRHELRWVYAKDYSVSSRDDAGYLDDVSFFPDGVQGPSIVSQPNAAIHVTTGERLSLDVSATGAGALSYRWFKDGNALVGETRDSLLCEPVTSLDAGVYQLWVDDGFSKVATQEIRVTVDVHAAAPVVSAQPQDVVASQGEAVSFSAGVSSEFALTLQWYRDGLPLSGQTSAVLNITDIDFGDAGVYFLLAMNEYGATETRQALLTVSESNSNIQDALDSSSLEWQSAGADSWYVQPGTRAYGDRALQTGEIDDGEISTVEATVEGPGTLYFSWKVSSEEGYDYLSFYRNGLLQTRISGEVDWTDVTYDLTAGSHELVWAYEKDQAFGAGYDSGWLDRVVFVAGAPGMPHIYGQPQSAYVNEGSRVVLGADALGSGTLSYQWKKEGIVLAGATEQNLTIDNFSAEDVGSYTVEVSNSVGAVVSEQAFLALPPFNDYGGYFEDSETIDEGWLRVEGIGHLVPVSFPWVYHAEHGWWNMAGSGNGEYWVFDFSLGWIWMTEKMYPYFWCHEKSSWFYFHGKVDKKRWFYDLAKREWVAHTGT